MITKAGDAKSSTATSAPGITSHLRSLGWSGGRTEGRRTKTRPDCAGHRSPKTEWIEAARRIRQLSPSSKIIFLSLYNSPDVVQGVLSTGALGYVHKTDAQSELLPAVDAVLRGRQFVSSSLKDCEFTRHLRRETPHRHEVQFYSDDAVFWIALVALLLLPSEAGAAAIVVATESQPGGSCVEIEGTGPGC